MEKLDKKDLKIEELQGQVDKLTRELAQLKKTLKDQAKQDKSTEKAILDSRSIVKAEHPNHSNDIMWDIASLPFYNLSNFELKVNWKKTNEALVKEGEIIVDVELIPSGKGVSKNISLESKVDGRLFILEDDKAEEGQAIGVVSDPADSRGDIIKWLGIGL